MNKRTRIVFNSLVETMRKWIKSPIKLLKLIRRTSNASKKYKGFH